jgi:pimeloyl-ACP methyl ester carboxylesterase
MPVAVTIPQLDQGMTAGQISRWLVGEGAAVGKGDPLFEVETDKAAVEIESPSAGTIRDIVAPAGTMVPVGNAVAWIFQEGEPYQAGTARLPLKGEGRPRSDRKEGTSDLRTPPSSLQGEGDARGTSENNLQPADTVKSAEPVRATPLARRLARERGIDLEVISGSGPRGRIQGRDIPDRPSAALASRAASQVVRTLNCVQLKEGKGTPIVFVHGFGAEFGSWRPFLSGSAFSAPILAVDLPGHGGSSLDGVDTFDDLAALLEQTLAAGRVSAAHLVGHSLGGAVVTALASRSLLDVRSLFLISPAGLGPEINGAFVAGFCRATSEQSLTPWMRLLVADPDRLSIALVRATLRLRSDPRIRDGHERIAAMLFPDGTQSFSVRDAFDGLTIPIKLIFGGDDRIIPAHHARGLPGHVAVHIFPDVGHLSHLEARAGVARLLDEIIRAGS